MLSSHKADAAAVAKNPTTTSCQVISHGSQPATYQCTKSNATPNSNTAACGQLILWWDANGGGDSLCLNTKISQSINLTDIPNPFRGVSWNDQASSYQVLCAGVAFFTDINRGGSSVTSGANTGIRNFTPGAVPNDTLSSVFINLGC